MVKVLKESLYTEMLMNKMIHMGFSQKKKKMRWEDRDTHKQD